MERPDHDHGPDFTQLLGLVTKELLELIQKQGQDILALNAEVRRLSDDNRSLMECWGTERELNLELSATVERLQARVRHLWNRRTA